MVGTAGLPPASRCRVSTRSGPRRAMGARAATSRSGAVVGTIALSYGSRRHAANAHTRRLFGSLTTSAPPQRGRANTMPRTLRRTLSLCRRSNRQRDESRIACAAVGVAILLLERHAPSADGGPFLNCRDHRLSNSRTRNGENGSTAFAATSPYSAFRIRTRLRLRQEAQRPTCRLAQVGRSSRSRVPSLARSLRSATSCLGPCTMNRAQWRPADAMLSVSRVRFTDERDAASGELANASQPHAVESERVGERCHETPMLIVRKHQSRRR